MACPSISEIESILSVTHTVMKGSYILSNPIEITNRFLKEIIPDRGLKSPEQFLTRIEYWFLEKGAIIPIQTSETQFKSLFSSRIGFRNLLSSFTPKISQIEVFSTIF